MHVCLLTCHAEISPLTHLHTHAHYFTCYIALIDTHHTLAYSHIALLYITLTLVAPHQVAELCPDARSTCVQQFLSDYRSDAASKQTIEVGCSGGSALQRDSFFRQKNTFWKSCMDEVSTCHPIEKGRRG